MTEVEQGCSLSSESRRVGFAQPDLESSFFTNLDTASTRHSGHSAMVAAIANGTKKRKHVVEDELKDAHHPEIPDKMGLELHSDEEDGENDSDGEVDAFPELDARSDTSEDEEDSEGEEDEVDEDEDDEDSEEDGENVSDAELSVFPKAKVVTSDITGQPKKVYPEIEPDYDSDSSTEDVSVVLSWLHEFMLTVPKNPNRVGNIPMHWYDDLPHIGYDVNGKKMFRPARGDELDKFLKTVEDPTAW